MKPKQVSEIKCQTVRLLFWTKEGFLRELKNPCPDLIISDYTLPSYDGLSALVDARERCVDIPFIFLSGTIGEEFAIETMKRGATDYVLKDRLSRLLPAITRALREAEVELQRTFPLSPLVPSGWEYEVYHGDQLVGVHASSCSPSPRSSSASPSQ